MSNGQLQRNRRQIPSHNALMARAKSGLLSFAISPVRDPESDRQIQQSGCYRPEHQKERVLPLNFVIRMNKHDSHNRSRGHEARREREPLESPRRLSPQVFECGFIDHIFNFFVCKFSIP